MKDFWGNISGGKLHTGSWFGGLLPDAGYTEKITDARGIPRDMVTGGSQGFGQYTQPAIINRVNQENPYDENTGTNYNRARGSNLPPKIQRRDVFLPEVRGPGDGPPRKTSEGNNDQMMNEIDSIFSPLQDYLGQMEGNIRSQQPGAEQNIMDQYGLSKTSLEGDKASGDARFGQMDARAGATREDAQSAAVRLYSELKRGGIQRFGGASSAGDAYGELTGNELQRNMGNVQKTYAQTIDTVNGYKAELQTKFTSALNILEQQKNTAIQDVQKFFQDKLLEVSRMTAENQSAKAQARLGLLTDLRNKVYAINMQDLQYKQQLSLNRQANEQQADSYAKQMISSLQGGDTATNTGQTGMMSGVGTNLGISSGQQVAQATPTGNIAQGQRKYDQYGNQIA